MKIAMLQLNFWVGDLDENTDKIIQGYRQACAQGAELAISTELAIFGYPPRDLLLMPDYLKKQDECLAKLCQEVGDVGLIVGIAENNSGKGTPLFNTAVLIHSGKVRHWQRKYLLPSYDVFDERRYFEPGFSQPQVINYRGKRLSILICEDIWGGLEIANGHRLYEYDPVEALSGIKVDALIVPNGSPYYWGKGKARLGLVAKTAQKLGCQVFYINQVGGNDEIIFDGRSFAVNSAGQCIGAAKAFEEDLVVIETDNALPVDYASDADSLKDLYRALVLGTRDYLRKINCQKGALIGLSGGIDSAITACITVEALGPDKVIGVSMPSQYSSEGSIKDAQVLAKNLGIKLWTVPIGNIYQSVGEALKPFIGWYEAGEIKGDVTEENVQARIRGMILMGISNRTGKILLTTGNKSELAVGYCTLYGDMAGGLAVISDVPKTTIYKLAQYINREQGIIPVNTITKPPSAELRPDQKDEDSLPPYEILDPILHMYVEEQKSLEEIVSSDVTDEKTVRWVISMVHYTEFKRRQMPPGLRVTAKAFGVGRRFPIAARLTL